MSRPVRRIAVFAVAALAVALTVSCGLAGSTPEFEEFVSEEGNFSVLMPGIPEHVMQTLNDPLLGPIGVEIFHVELRTGAYFAAYSDYPQAFIDSVDQSLVLDGARDGGGRKHRRESTLRIDHLGRRLSLQTDNSR
ncbi:MAG: hypothetical protein O2854_09875 [Chloroflexi bacterium]|nr:hypothetical protein [Chloroflexota bacterium]